MDSRDERINGKVAMECFNDFKNALSEINILLSYSKRHSKDSNPNEYQLFNKMSVILLCTCFESFIESFIDDLSCTIKNRTNNKNIPDFMKANYKDDSLCAYFDPKNKKEQNKILTDLIRLLSKETIEMKYLSNLKLKTRFNYGKHGEKEIKKLFEKFGLKDFCNTEEISLLIPKLNGLISIRNNVIHENAAPNLTFSDIKDYKTAVTDFINHLQDFIIKNQINIFNVEIVEKSCSI